MTVYEIVDYLKAGTVVSIDKREVRRFIKCLTENKINLVFNVEIKGVKARLIPIKDQEKNIPFRTVNPKHGRNDLCACGSGKKFKKCCLNGQNKS